MSATMSSNEGFNFSEKRISVVKVPHVSFQKRGNYTINLGDGRRLAANRQMARGVNRPFGFVGNPNSPTMLITGMDEYVINPYFNRNLEDIPLQYHPRDGWAEKFKEVRAKEKVTRQMLYEIMDNVPEGYYSSVRKQPLMTSSMANADTFRKTEQSFLETFKVFLHEGTNVFENRTQRGRLGILICENHPKIAISRDKIREGFHDFYIASAEEVIEEQARRDNRLMEAIVRLHSILNDYDPFIGYQFAIVTKAVKGNVPQREAAGALREYVMEPKRIMGATQEDRWNEFNKFYQGFKESPNSLYASYLMRQAYLLGIFRDISGEIVWVTQKGRDNWFNLGTNSYKVRDAFILAMDRYDPDIAEDNMFATLEAEIKSKGVPTK